MPSAQVISHRSSASIVARLSAMMFLQSWPLGVWGVTVATYLAANTGDRGDGIYSAGFAGYSTAAGALGGLIAPAVVGWMSDRYFSAQRLLAVMQAGCAAAAWGMYTSETQLELFLWLLFYFHCYVPSAALANKIGLRNLVNVNEEFPRIRVFGAAGWITAGLFVGLLWPAVAGVSIEATRTPFLIGACASVAMALYALTLPHTPPEPAGKGGERTDWKTSLAALANGPLVVFLIIAMLACIPSMAYNNFVNPFLNFHNYPHPAALLTLGQASELACLWVMPWLLTRTSLKRIFFAGLVAWVLRYLCLAAGASMGYSWVVILSILLHGPCYAFINTAGQMYTDRLADPSKRGAAQGLFATATLGLANLGGAFVVGLTQQTLLTPEGVSPPPYNWLAFWSVSASLSTLVAIAFLVVYARPSRCNSQNETLGPELRA